MTDEGALRRVELTLVLLVLTALGGLAVLSVDAVRFHLLNSGTVLLTGEWGESDVGAMAAALLVLCEFVVALLFTGSLARRNERQRELVASLAGRHRTKVGGYEVVLFSHAQPVAFCAGLLRPDIYLSRTALMTFDERELAAVLAHEAAHARRRDPLRIALATAAADTFRWIPWLNRLAERESTVAELLADEAAVRSMGGAGALASAMLQVDRTTGGGVLPQRVDRLAGRPPSDGVSALLLGATAVGVSILTGISFALAFSPVHPASLCVVAVASALPVIVAPAMIAALRAGRALDPA